MRKYLIILLSIFCLQITAQKYSVRLFNTAKVSYGNFMWEKCSTSRPGVYIYQDSKHIQYKAERKTVFSYAIQSQSNYFENNKYIQKITAISHTGCKVNITISNKKGSNTYVLYIYYSDYAMAIKMDKVG